MHAQLPLNFQLQFEWQLQTEGLPHASLVYISCQVPEEYLYHV